MPEGKMARHQSATGRKKERRIFAYRCVLRKEVVRTKTLSPHPNHGQTGKRGQVRWGMQNWEMPAMFGTTFTSAFS